VHLQIGAGGRARSRQSPVVGLQSRSSAMDLRIGSIVVHCYEFDRMVEFWRRALGYVPLEAASDGWVVLRDPAGKGPNVSFQKRIDARPAEAGCTWICTRATSKARSSGSSSSEHADIRGATLRARISSFSKIRTAICSASSAKIDDLIGTRQLCDRSRAFFPGLFGGAKRVSQEDPSTQTSASKIEVEPGAEEGWPNRNAPRQRRQQRRSRLVQVHGLEGDMVLIRSIGFVVAMVMAWPCAGLAQTTFYAAENGALVCDSPKPLHGYKSVFRDASGRANFLTSDAAANCQLIPKASAYQPAEAKAAFSSAEAVVRLHLKGDKKSVYALRGEWLAISQEDIAGMLQTVRTCIISKWKPKPAQNVNIIVKIRLRFNADGRLAEPPTIPNQKDDPTFRAVSENAVQAVRACEPFKLPKDKYEVWKEMVINFVPISH
jgi:hypothetical protein